MLRWCSMGACALILATWIVSAWRPITLFGNTYYVVISNGRLRGVRYEGPPAEIRRELLIWQKDYRAGDYGLGWEGLLGGLLLGEDDLREVRGVSLCSLPMGSFEAPVGIALLVVGFPTAVLWRRQLQRLYHRRVQDGLCQHCEYDLRGNISGICPECGTPLTEEQRAAVAAADATATPGSEGGRGASGPRPS